MKRTSFAAGLLLLILLVGGCRQSRQAATADLQIDVAPVPFPAVVGPSRLVVRVRDAAGAPVDDATLAIKGDMTHAGMEPVLANAAGGSNGTYEMPFEWTMAGDWVVTVRAALPDGRTAEQRFDFAVDATADDLCTHEEMDGG